MFLCLFLFSMIRKFLLFKSDYMENRHDLSQFLPHSSSTQLCFENSLRWTSGYFLCCNSHPVLRCVISLFLLLVLTYSQAGQKLKRVGYDGYAASQSHAPVSLSQWLRFPILDFYFKSMYLKKATSKSQNCSDSNFGVCCFVDVLIRSESLIEMSFELWRQFKSKLYLVVFLLLFVEQHPVG